jgi:transposase
MPTVTTIGLDLAKKVFQVHGVDAGGKVVVARRLRRKEVLAFFAKLAPCLVGMEACGSAHYWAREIIKLGHTVKLMPPRYVNRPPISNGGVRGRRIRGLARVIAARCGAQRQSTPKGVTVAEVLMA